jgi:hypothetical protein
VTVFVSFSSRDKDAVESLTQDLHDADEQVWMDQRFAGRGKRGTTAAGPNWYPVSAACPKG